MVATANGHRDAVIELVKAGADPEKENSAGQNEPVNTNTSGPHPISSSITAL